MKNHIWSRILTVTLLLHCKVGLKAEGIKPNTAESKFKNLYFDLLISELHSSLSCLSCKNRCGSKENITADPNDPKGACTCDETCVLFGNCCPDILVVCPGINIKMTSFELLTRIPNTECYWQGMCHGEAMYLLINDCPFSERVCERTTEKAITGIPVVDLDTHISYSNALCALCNGATDIMPWDIIYSRSIISCAEECYKPHIWSQDLVDNTQRFHPPRFLRPRQRCNYHYPQISECSSNWSDGTIRQACENGGISLVHTSKEALSGFSEIQNYKNLFCAVCNFENIDKLRCGFSWNLAYCDGPPVYSLEKLFYMNSNVGMLSSVCPAGETYIEEEKQCRKVHLFTDNQVEAYFEIWMSLHYEKENELPLHTANALINYVEKEFIHLNFFIGNNSRSWKHKLDFIQIGAFKNSNFTGDFIASAINISNMWADVQRQSKHEIALIISTYNGNCEYSNYSLSASTFDEQGNVNISGGPSRKPGEYHIVKNTIYTCIEISETQWMFSATIGWITIVSMAISIICIVMLLVLKCVFPETGKDLVVILAFCLLVSQVSFLIGPQLRFSYPACYTAGVIMHWAFLSSFAWMAAVAFDIYYLVSRAEKLKKTSENSKFWKIILPFVFPTLFVVFCVAIEESPMPYPWKPSYGTELCWLNGSIFCCSSWNICVSNSYFDYLYSCKIMLHDPRHTTSRNKSI